MDTERTTKTEDVSQLTDEQWRERLDPEAYEVLRHAATERPFTGAFVDNKDTGMYHCAGCGAPLFSSETKFDSGCGWPSFYAPVESENVINRLDSSHGMIRTEVALQELRRPPRSRVRGRPRADRPALLHQLGGAGLRQTRVRCFLRLAVPLDHQLTCRLVRAGPPPLSWQALLPSRPHAPELACPPPDQSAHEQYRQHDRGDDPDALEDVRNRVSAEIADEPVGDRPGDSARRRSRGRRP